MAGKTKKWTPQDIKDKKSQPPGRIKIAEALRELLKEKDFNSITTAEISRTSGVNEALIYRYFKDKRGLLHEVLAEFFEHFLLEVHYDLKGIEGWGDKLRKLIWSHFNYYSRYRIFAKILLLEVRNHPGYFESATYQTVKQYSGVILDIIEDGIRKGEIRDDISSAHIRDMILGGIEHFCMTSIIFNREISPDDLQAELCTILFDGIRKAGVEGSAK